MFSPPSFSWFDNEFMVFWIDS